VLPTPDGGLRMLTDGVDGTFAPKVALPAANLVPKPANLSFEEAAGLGTAWLTAYRMLFTKAQLRPGERLLVQGASGGVSTAAIMLAVHAGAHVTVTSRKEEALEKARQLGAHEGVISGGKLPKRVDVVLETVGEATWGHSMKSLNQGGRIVVAGATTGSRPSADLNRLFYREIQVLGSAMGTLDEFKTLCAFVEHADLHPPVSEVYDGVEKVRDAMRVLEAGEQFGKLVIRP
jgi:NADPH:quinone reductase-like Zn-dependent oxidoreductase